MLCQRNGLEGVSMKNKKYMLFTSRKQKLMMFKIDIENFFKIIFRKRAKESKVAKETLQEILDKNEYLKIPEYLKDAGFIKIESEDEPTAKELVENATALAVANRNVHLMEVELTLYSDVKGYEDRYLIDYMLIDYSKGSPQPYHQGMYCDSVHKTQKETIELKNLIKRLMLQPQYN